MKDKGMKAQRHPLEKILEDRIAIIEKCPLTTRHPAPCVAKIFEMTVARLTSHL